MISSIIGFLVMLNPFALFLYLEPVRKDLNFKSFTKVLFKASLISLLVCVLFFYLGESIFNSFFQIDFESFRIFGGIIIFSYAYYYIVKGQKALIMMKEDLDDLASEIALPFMVGAGTISLSILLSEKTSALVGTIMLVLIFIINFSTILSLKKFRDYIESRNKKFKTAFDKNMEILLRINGFFIGAIGIDMMITGLLNTFF